MGLLLHGDPERDGADDPVPGPTIPYPPTDPDRGGTAPLALRRDRRIIEQVLTQLPTSTFVPAALGFFGLGTGYLIWGPQELFGFPRRSPEVDRSLGVWGVFLPGLCQLLTGILLFVGLTWLQVFKDPALYMAALAFTAYGIHWFALGWNRYRGNDPRPNAGMSVAFTVLSVLGAFVFFHADVWPLGVLFIGLAGVYVADFAVAAGAKPFERVLGLVHVVTGLWLMYLTVATVLNTTSGYHLPA